MINYTTPRIRNKRENEKMHCDTQSEESNKK